MRNFSVWLENNVICLAVEWICIFNSRKVLCDRNCFENMFPESLRTHFNMFFNFRIKIYYSYWISTEYFKPDWSLMFHIWDLQFLKILELLAVLTSSILFTYLNCFNILLGCFYITRQTCLYSSFPKVTYTLFRYRVFHEWIENI